MHTMTVLGIELKSFGYHNLQYDGNMADGGPPAPQPPPVIPPVVHPVPTVQLPTASTQPIVLPSQSIQPAPILQLNWSLFKPEFAGKLDEDVETHPLRTNDWMDTHAFLEGVKVQQFCLMMVGKARLWNELLRPIALDQNGLQNHFRQQYSKIGNAKEQLFNAWR